MKKEISTKFNNLKSKLEKDYCWESLDEIEMESPFIKVYDTNPESINNSQNNYVHIGLIVVLPESDEETTTFEIYLMENWSIIKTVGCIWYNANQAAIRFKKYMERYHKQFIVKNK